MNFSNCLEKQTTTVIYKTNVSTSLPLISTLDFLLPLIFTSELLKILGKLPTCCTITLYKTFIIVILYMFRATRCSSSGGRIVSRIVLCVSDHPVCRRTPDHTGHIKNRKHYSAIGRRNHGIPLKRLLVTRDRNGSTRGPSP